MTNQRTRVVAAIALLAIGACASRSIGQQTAAQKKQTPRVIQYSGDMANFLAAMANSYETTIGLEVDPKQLNSQVTISVRDATLTDVLDAVVKSAPIYEWRERDGVIEVLPKSATNPLLDTMISYFRLTDVDQAEGLKRLLNLPEVQASLKAMTINRREPAAIETKGQKFSLTLENVTMRQALSRIAGEGGGRFWIFRLFGDGSLSISNSPR